MNPVFLLIFGFLVVLTGCASRSDTMLKNLPPAASVAADNPLQHKLAVGEVTGAGNVVMHLEAVSNDTFKAVLQRRLADSGLAATGSPSYIVNAELDYDVSIDFPWNDRSAEEDVIYTVREVAS